MGFYSSYQLHLYCDHPQANKHTCPNWPEDFFGENHSSATKSAKKAGWYIRNKDKENLVNGFGLVYCPLHKQEMEK